ncbi:uncharacterized protein LOC127257104 [Andrographis paniculata]|uniref:uncharacterized protein LOC127257104 n=1 Tax=Andrographis paniculata TaxID=175694 RepID=UPI0021E9379F|nr:uncharacterized protein LOC127257104 [Andrographis paniculata]
MISILRRKITCCLFADYASPHCIARSFCLRLFSTSNEGACVSSAAIFDLLQQKHHFSAEVATKAASVLNRVKDTEKCNSMLSYLQQRGFSNTQMEKMVKVWPELLLARFSNSIEPKIKVFQDMGFSSKDITKIISANPSILKVNLNSRVIPLLSMLKGSLGNNEAVAKFVSRSGWFVTVDFKRTMLPNIELLKSYGVPMERIIKLMYTFPRCMMLNPESFRKSVEKAEEMGANRSSRMFIHAVQALCQMSDNVLELKLKALRNCGFTESDILVLFQKSPSVVVMSADNIRTTKDFILSNGKYGMPCILNNPAALSCSIEQRYKPRFQTLEILENRSLIKYWPTLASLCQMSDEKFFERFICPYSSELKNACTADSSLKLKHWLKNCQ